MLFRSKTKGSAYLIAKPLHIGCEKSILGRATKGFVAYDLQEGRLAFFKDAWRENDPYRHPEVETYRRFVQHGVNNVATALAGGDVRTPESKNVQRTASHKYVRRNECERIHTRIVTREIGIALKEHVDSRELTTFMFQALLGMLKFSAQRGILLICCKPTAKLGRRRVCFIPTSVKQTS